MLPDRRPYDTVKRAMDVTVSAVGLVISAPVQLAVAGVVLAAHGRPVLFRQPRPGRDGVVFELVKFRTMRHPDSRHQSDAERLTRVGRFLRSTSLDELPTLWNVLKGDIPLRILKTRPEFSEKSMGAFALPAKSSTNKGKAFSQVVSCFANGLRMRRISKFNCNRIRGMEAQFLAKPVFGAVCA